MFSTRTGLRGVRLVYALLSISQTQTNHKYVLSRALRELLLHIYTVNAATYRAEFSRKTRVREVALKWKCKSFVWIWKPSFVALWRRFHITFEIPHRTIWTKFLNICESFMFITKVRRGTRASESRPWPLSWATWIVAWQPNLRSVFCEW
jgi:hypothetical protein